MSAWIVSKKHIDVLVAALVEEQVIKLADADETGRILWRENHKSVNARYAEKTRAPAYTFEHESTSNVVVLKSIHCYEYQTCEHDGWKRSRARQLCLELTSRIAYALAQQACRKAYDDAPWGIS